MNKPITLDKLTPEQVEMLEILWSLDNEQDFEAWHETLDDNESRMCETLMTLVVLESWDEEITSNLTQAQTLLKQFTL
jgi:hypothetical protein